MDKLNEGERTRYQRQMLLAGWGEGVQATLKAKAIGVVGAGGLGCSALLQLTAVGFGRIIIVDRDTVELSNLNRQVLHWEADLERPKAHSASEKLRRMNSNVKVEAVVAELKHENIDRILGEVDALIVNDSEARQLTGRQELARAGREILKLGPRLVIIKKGEHGSAVVSRDDLFALPAFPLDEVADPTGAGDSFAGGILGYLAAQGDLSAAVLRRAVAYGTVVASFCCEDFSLDALARLTRKELNARFRRLMEIVRVPL